MSAKIRWAAVGATLLSVAACSGAGVVDERETTSTMSDVPATASDVREDDLASLDDPDEIDMRDLDDDALASPDARADVPLGDALEVESACGELGSHPAWKRGAQLVTTEWLNLRTGPSTSDSRILVMAPSTAVVVVSHNCGRRWVHVADGEHVGYAAIDWLREKSPDAPAPVWESYYSPSRGKKLAQTAWHLWRYHEDAGVCLRGTRESVEAAISPSFWPPVPGASQFGDFALDHTHYMREHHLKAFAANDPDAPKPKDFPKGTIIVWHADHCHSDKTYGHVEIIVNDKIACSDYCRVRSDRECAPDVVILPRH